jgi:hypothetical protein
MCVCWRCVVGVYVCVLALCSWCVMRVCDGAVLLVYCVMCDVCVCDVCVCVGAV